MVRNSYRYGILTKCFDTKIPEFKVHLICYKRWSRYCRYRYERQLVLVRQVVLVRLVVLVLACKGAVEVGSQIVRVNVLHGEQVGIHWREYVRLSDLMLAPRLGTVDTTTAAVCVGPVALLAAALLVIKAGAAAVGRLETAHPPARLLLV